MVGFDRMFWTQNQWVKKLIEKDVIGKVMMARASFHEHWYLYQNHVAKTDFRLAAEVGSGVSLPDVSVHPIDLLT